MTELETAVHAAQEAGKLLRANFHRSKDVDEALHHDLKLALDKESQDLITGIILKSSPGMLSTGKKVLLGTKARSTSGSLTPSMVR